MKYKNSTGLSSMEEVKHPRVMCSGCEGHLSLMRFWWFYEEIPRCADSDYKKCRWIFKWKDGNTCITQFIKWIQSIEEEKINVLKWRK